MSENPRRGRQARNFTTNVPKILDLKSSSEQIFFRKFSLGAPAISTDPTDCSWVSEDEIISRTFSKPRAIFDKRNRNFIFLPHVTEYGLRNPEVRHFCLWNRKSGKILLAESGIIGFGIRNTAKKIRNPTNN